MKLERAFLRSRVVRRIVALFVACTLVPIVAMAILSYGHVRKLLLDQSHEHLAQLAREEVRDLGRLLDEIEMASPFRRQGSQQLLVEVVPEAERRGADAFRAEPCGRFA